jgi:hypothetical protein
MMASMPMVPPPRRNKRMTSQNMFQGFDPSTIMSFVGQNMQGNNNGNMAGDILTQLGLSDSSMKNLQNIFQNGSAGNQNEMLRTFMQNLNTSQQQTVQNMLTNFLPESSKSSTANTGFNPQNFLQQVMSSGGQNLMQQGGMLGYF